MSRAEGTDPLSIGMVRSGTSGHGAGLAEGELLVYSATDEFSDGDLIFNAHSSYLIYTFQGEVLKSVDNHMSRSDEIPERVSLPAGSYIVEARSASNGCVRVQVTIKPGQQTVLDLDRWV